MWKSRWAPWQKSSDSSKRNSFQGHPIRCLDALLHGVIHAQQIQQKALCLPVLSGISQFLEKQNLPFFLISMHETGLVQVKESRRSSGTEQKARRAPLSLEGIFSSHSLLFCWQKKNSQWKQIFFLVCLAPKLTSEIRTSVSISSTFSWLLCDYAVNSTCVGVHGEGMCNAYSSERCSECHHTVTLETGNWNNSVPYTLSLL